MFLGSNANKEKTGLAEVEGILLSLGDTAFVKKKSSSIFQSSYNGGKSFSLLFKMKAILLIYLSDTLNRSLDSAEKFKSHKSFKSKRLTSHGKKPKWKYLKIYSKKAVASVKLQMMSILPF